MARHALGNLALYFFDGPLPLELILLELSRPQTQIRQAFVALAQLDFGGGGQGLVGGPLFVESGGSAQKRCDLIFQFAQREPARLQFFDRRSPGVARRFDCLRGGCQCQTVAIFLDAHLRIAHAHGAGA